MKDLEKITQIAQRYAQDNCNQLIEPPHLLKAILHKDFELIDFIETTLNKDYYYFLDWADMQIQLIDKTTSKSSDLEYSDKALAVINEAEQYKEQLELPETNALSILAALVMPGVGFSYEQLKSLPVTTQEIMHFANTSSKTATTSQSLISHIDNGALAKYCINHSTAPSSTPTIGFEREIATIFEVLSRKTKCNLLVTGESGVGKTALMRGFVQRLAQENVPQSLKNSVVYELNLSSVTAGASYKGEVEDRVKEVLDAIEEFENSVLIIESIEKMFDQQGILFGARNILKQKLAAGRVKLLCSTTIDGFTKHLETDKEFVRQLDKITIDQPNDDQCFRILKGAISQYEQYHNLSAPDEVLVEAIRLSKRYLTEKALPDSAFDLLDRTMAQIRNMNDLSRNDIHKLQQKLNNLLSQNADTTTQMTELAWLHYEIFNRLSCLLTAQLDEEVDFAKIDSPSARIDYLRSVLNKLDPLTESPHNEVLSTDLFAVIAKQTGIPLGKVQSRERDKLVNGESILKKRVIGQDHAIKIVLDAIYESRSGLNKKGQPMGSFFFLGPTGTGKTELSKSLVEFLFGDERSLIRFDMSEFKEEHSVALLYGAPPGYVGYEEGGLLVNKIRQNPYSVVLFDEIEKAHKSVFDLFLQILDEGKLHDRLGRVGDFSNALILFTSNIGSKFIVDSFGKGIIPKSNDLMDIMQEHFRPEFLGRLTEIVPFSPITEETVTRIFDIHLNNLKKQLAEQHITLYIDDATKKAIAMNGFNPQYGARPIIGIIRKELRRPLSKLIIAGKITCGDTVTATLDENNNVQFNKN